MGMKKLVSISKKILNLEEYNSRLEKENAVLRAALFECLGGSNRKSFDKVCSNIEREGIDL